MSDKVKASDLLKNGMILDNPVFVQAVGMCPTLAVTTSAENGIGMGLATTAVLMCSNLIISLIKKLIPDKVRIPCFIIVIATFVTLIEFALKAYLPELNSSLGIFIPLIVVNCLVLARAEAFASKNNPALSLIDGLSMGLGFTFALFVIGAIREFFGAGEVLGITLLPEGVARTIIMILPAGAFITLGFLMALLNFLRRDK